MATPWDEVGEGVYRRRYRALDFNVGAVIGAAAVLVIDTRSSHREADEVRAELAGLTSLPVGWVVNTHWHWDHVLGNARFAGAEGWGHVATRERMLADPEGLKASAIAGLGEERRAEVEEVVVVPPNHTVASAAVLDLGGREVRLRHLGLGHTDGDLVVEVLDAGVVFAGDLLEQGAPPYFGDGYPLAWPATVAALTEHPGTTVPGHGDVMATGEVAAQHRALTWVAEWCRRVIAGDLEVEPPADAPFPAPTLRSALVRARLEVEDQAGG